MMSKTESEVAPGVCLSNAPDAAAIAGQASRARETWDAHLLAERLFETAQVIILVLDLEGRIYRFNRHLELLTGYTLAEMRGQDWCTTFVPVAEQNRVRALLANLRTAPPVVPNVNPILTREGRERQIEWRNTLLPDPEGNPLAILAIGQDVTERLYAEAELVRTEKLRALGQLAAGIAHDLNNSLAVILGQTELLRLRGGASDSEEGVRTLEAAALDAAQVVQRLQDFSRQRTNEPIGPLDLKAVVQEALELTRPRWEEESRQRGIQIQITTALSNVPPILGHGPEVREALTHLIENALDAMPQGGRLSLTAQADQERVRLAITDTGVGMPESTQGRIFDPFFTTKGLRGTGLGLSVVYGIMARHGGRIMVTSTPGRGATFQLDFQVAGEAPPALEPLTAWDLAPRRLLLIDDEDLVRATLADLLRSSGHTVAEAADGPAGLLQFARSQIDCVVTDLGMPEMTGWDVARAVKSRQPGLPVLMLTGWGEQAAVATATEGLVDRILTKPIRLAELLRAIGEITAAPRLER